MNQQALAQRPPTNIVEFPRIVPKPQDDLLLDINEMVTGGADGFLAFPTYYGWEIRNQAGEAVWQMVRLMEVAL